MSKQLQLRRGTTAEHSTFTGAVGETTVDTDKDVIVVHDGVTAGGHALAKQSAVDLKAPLASPALTGTPTAPTASAGTSSTQIATTAFVNAEIANDTYLKNIQDWRGSMMSKAAFNALAAERRANRAGSGFDEFGRGRTTASYNVNDGIWTDDSVGSINRFSLGKNTPNLGTSKTDFPMIAINGVTLSLKNINYTSFENNLLQPPAPTVLPYDATLTPEQIASGVIKHADASNSGLIVNGKFDTDTSGWTAGAGAILDISAGKLRFHSETNNTLATYYRTVSGLVIGKKYIVEFEYSGNAANRYCRVDAGSNSATSNSATYGILINESIIIGRNYIEFTPNEPTCHIKMQSYLSATYVEFDNIAVFPADAISRSDLVFLESWHEDVSEKDFVYPLGNVQYLGATGDAGTPVAGAFTGSSTYSLFGNWQASGTLVGKGYVWSTLTDAQKKAFVANPENNCYLDGDKYIQVRYRMRVVAGVGDNWGNLYPYNNYLYCATGIYPKPKGKQVSIVSDYGISDSLGIFGHGSSNWTASLPYAVEYGIFSATPISGSTLGFTLGSYNGQCFALPIALVHRRNSGVYNVAYNPNGTKLASDGNKWYNTAVSFTSVADCFDSSKLLTASGYIGTTSGRPDGLFYDQVHEGDITDLRMSSQKVEDYNRLINREFNKLVAGTYRGSEGEYSLATVKQTFSTATGVNMAIAKINGISPYSLIGTCAYHNGYSIRIVSVADNATNWTLIGQVTINRVLDGDVILAIPTTRTKSNTLTHTDIIGSPANYPTAWKQSGVSGTPLIVAEDGTSLLPTGALAVFKLSRKANATPLQVLKSTDSGATWTALVVTTNYTFDTFANALTFVAAPASTDLIMVTYQTHTNMAVAGINSEVLGVGEGIATNTCNILMGVHLATSLIGKIATGSTSFSAGNLSNKKFSVSGILLDVTGLPNNKIYQGSPLNVPTHTSIVLTDTTSTVKMFPYLTRLNGKARLQLVFKEMKYSGTSWGDHDNTFNIVDNVSTTTDGNGQTILIGQKYAELPYFISAGE